ncbi:uncharacterized protein PRCAT00003967001 [Priceomyces carsonii]|uniref:uncharacterized protein n=1 Tax=Priceomyces carsonii TaxID=28549 RepID=UPI002ED949E8|nr:unnamed protein product [Priceomyces carsonii]
MTTTQQTSIKRHRSWFGRHLSQNENKKNELDVESYSNGKDLMNDLQQPENIYNTNLVNSEEEREEKEDIQEKENIFSINRELIQKDIDKLELCSDDDSHVNSESEAKRKNRFLRNIKGLSQNVDDEEHTTCEPERNEDKEDILDVGPEQETDRGPSEAISRPRSQNSFGPSVTPLRIRDNINYLLGYSQPEPVQEKTELETEKQEEEERTWMKPQNRASRDVSKAQSLIDRYSGIPCNRSALLDCRESSAFMFELNLSRKKDNDYSLYFKWALWFVSLVDGKKRSNIDRLIENSLDLKILIKDFKKIIESKAYYKFHIFKLGHIPNRTSADLLNGDTLEVRVPQEYKVEFTKEVVKLVLKGDLYKPQSLQSK